MFYCRSCLYPSTKPDLWFKDGICGACHSYEDRKNYDWNKSKKLFKIKPKIQDATKNIRITKKKEFNQKVIKNFFKDKKNIIKY